MRPRPLPRAAAALAVSLMVAPALAADGPALRGDVVAARDTLTLGDLVAGAPAALAATPVFRAPALGQTGTIQARRILAAAEALGLGAVETGGRSQVTVSRAARQIGAGEIEGAVRRALVRDFGLEPAATGIRFEGVTPGLLVEAGLEGQVEAADVSFDRRTRRLVATVWIGPSPTERVAQQRLAGSAVDLVEVAVLGRNLERGEAVKAADIALERRPRDSVPSDAVYDGAPLEGRVARRPLSGGALLRPVDLIRPEIVGKGDIVTVVYQTPGVTLSMRMSATEGGALGDTVAVVNAQSKKTLQAVVTGPGRVSVTAFAPARLAAARAP